jgi:hypothetical protein
MKNWMKPNKLEWISFLSLMPVLTLVLNLVLFGKRVWTDWTTWVFSYPVLLLLGLASWYAHIFSMHWLRARFPDISQTRLRLILLALNGSLCDYPFAYQCPCHGGGYFVGS